MICISASLCLAQRASANAAKPRLLTPSALAETAPAVFSVAFDTTASPFVIEVHRDWAPRGVDRFYNLTKNGFYDGCAFFRVVPNFMAQFGLHGDPAVQAAWRTATIRDDPVKHSNTRGSLSFVAVGVNSRTTQVFINYGDNTILDSQGFAPFGEVVTGKAEIVNINALYLERPDQRRIEHEGNAYLAREFPRLSYIKTARIQPAPAPR